MDKKNLLVFALIGVIIALVVLIAIPISVINSVENNGVFNNSAEVTSISASLIGYKVFVNGITPVAVYNYVSKEVNQHLFKKDNSYEKGTYSKSDYYIKWTNDIKSNYSLNNNQEKGEAVFNYTYYHIVTKWHAHGNTLCSIQDVANYHEANCAETSRIVYNLCLAVGIPKEDVQYVHSASQHHYWVQVRCGGNWTNIDASHAADDTYNITKFGLAQPASDVQVILEDQIA